jgi:beta-N-acetylhexosaminidase
MAAELRAVGVDFSFAPVLDLRRGRSAAIGDRAYHADPEVVASLAGESVAGMRETGMAAVGKHFPGHGYAEVDSHVALPEDPRSLATLRLEDILPFERLIHRGLPGVMPAHVVFSEVDGRPAVFSRRWLGDVLRAELDFKGAVFSDDLSMAAAETGGDPVARARRALAAGCDMVLVCNRPDAAREVVEGLSGYENAVRGARLTPMHGRKAPDWGTLRADGAHLDAARAVADLEPAPELDLGDDTPA